MNLRIIYLRALQRAKVLSYKQERELQILLADPSNEQQVEEMMEELWNEPELTEAIFQEGEKKAMLKNILSAGLSTGVEKHRSVKLPSNSLANWIKISAAVVFISLSTSLFLYVNSSNNVKETAVLSSFAPGGEKAFLTMANGTKFSLSDIETGDHSKYTSNGISKTEDGFLKYQPVTFEKGTNVLATPRGGQYKIILPDGTKVWMNAATTLKFPVVFDAGTRRVELHGEAYFEVAKDKTKPFQVSSLNQMVEVHGTHFNINSYPEESSVITTLFEGSVTVSDLKSGERLLLKPGQQASLSNSLSLEPGELEKAVAWKEGYFLFEHEDLGSIMRKLSRWYDVKIQIQNEELNNLRFAGTVNRFQNLADVLKMLELTGDVKFRTEQRTVIAYKQ